MALECGRLLGLSLCRIQLTDKSANLKAPMPKRRGRFLAENGTHFNSNTQFDFRRSSELQISLSRNILIILFTLTMKGNIKR
ncbi:hypothetical protein OUZ56_022942 [Daphnia magna]|uniref:Uncharacterized protein n=1 Tax=Daphnia magna TaxID=35525 RepID=A0ABR0AY18_9CRUS|nr:hypothetical protein OUZ56_022942 [Daphnia magna]